MYAAVTCHMPVICAAKPGAEVYPLEFFVGVCRLVPQILTLFQTEKGHFPHPFSQRGPVFRKSRQLFEPGKLLCVCRVYIQGQSFNNFENNKMKLSVNEAKFSTGLWTRNRAAIQQFLDFKFFFGPEKFPCLTKNVPLAASKICTHVQTHIAKNYVIITC